MIETVIVFYGERKVLSKVVALRVVYVNFTPVLYTTSVVFKSASHELLSADLTAGKGTTAADNAVITIIPAMIPVDTHREKGAVVVEVGGKVSLEEFVVVLDVSDANFNEKDAPPFSPTADGAPDKDPVGERDTISDAMAWGISRVTVKGYILGTIGDSTVSSTMGDPSIVYTRLLGLGIFGIFGGDNYLIGLAIQGARRRATMGFIQRLLHYHKGCVYTSTLFNNGPYRGQCEHYNCVWRYRLWTSFVRQVQCHRVLTTKRCRITHNFKFQENGCEKGGALFNGGAIIRCHGIVTRLFGGTRLINCCCGNCTRLFICITCGFGCLPHNFEIRYAYHLIARRGLKVYHGYSHCYGTLLLTTQRLDQVDLNLIKGSSGNWGLLYTVLYVLFTYSNRLRQGTRVFWTITLRWGIRLLGCRHCITTDHAGLDQERHIGSFTIRNGFAKNKLFGRVCASGRHTFPNTTRASSAMCVTILCYC